MKNAHAAVRTVATAALFTLLPSLAHAHTDGAAASGILHDVAHTLFGGQHLVAVPAAALVVAGIAFGAIRRFRSSVR